MKLFAFLPALLLLSGVYAQTPQQQNNLETFARLYGYVKYFHPSDEAAGLDWDKFAIYGADAVLSSRSDAELAAALKKLFQPIAPTVQIGNKLSFNMSSITPENKADYKPVFWFHTGVGFSENPIYSSVRLNRPEPSRKNSQQQDFVPFTQAVDAPPLRGREIKLTGRMKAAVQGYGTGHFWLRVDKENGKTGFFYNMNDAPVTKNEWQTYEFTGKVDADAKSIYFGGFLSGYGTIWADDITLFEREKATDAWKPVAIKNGNFEESEDSTAPTGWYVGSLAGYRSALNADNNNKVLEISGDQPDAPIGNMVNTVDYKFAPEPGAIVHEKIAKNIEIIVPIVLYGTARHTYPAGNTAAVTQLKKDMDKFFSSNGTAESRALRLGNVAITWNIFKHFFPYWEDASKKPEAILRQAIVKSFTDKDPAAFRETLLIMTAPLNDGHIWVAGPENTIQGMLPLKLTLAEGKIVVDKVLDKDISAVQPGDIIEKIDGSNTMDDYREKSSLISGSPQLKTHRTMSDFGSGTVNTTATLSLLRNGKPIEVKLVRSINKSQHVASIRDLRKKSGQITEDVYYLDLNEVAKDTIDTWASKLAQARGVICDLRGYPKGNHNLINYLLKEEEDTKWMFVPKTAYPDQQKIQLKEFGWNMKPQKPAINGKVVFITDGSAISYAESYMGFIKDFKLATIIGQPTAGTNGNVNPFRLPGGYTISWTGMLVRNHDGSKHHIKGIIPDIPMERTIKGIAAEKDEFYEKAIQLINEQ